MLAHELAHLKRHDLMWNWLPTIVGWLFFFHPLVWLLKRSWLESQEAACDELLLQNSAARPSEYGRLLLKLSTRFSEPPRAGLAAAGVMGAYRDLERRLLAMSRVKPFSHRRLLLAATVLLILAPFVIVPWRLVAQETAISKNSDHASEKITLSGKCIDEHEQPVANARARLFIEDYTRSDTSQRQLQEVRTDENGNFVFANVDAKPVRDKRATLVVVAQTPERATVSEYIGPQHLEQAKLDFKLIPAAAIRGRVLNSEGKPVAGATVFTMSCLIEPVPGICAATTDADGRFVIADLRPWDPAGPHNSIVVQPFIGFAQHPDYAKQSFTYSKVPDTVDITLPHEAVVSGRVIFDESGEPAPGATVEFDNGRMDPNHPARTRTDEEGRYQLTKLPPGKYRMYCKLPNFPPLWRDDVQLQTGANVLDLRMEKGGIVHGRVIDITTDKPVTWAKPGVRMQISGCDHHGYSGAGMPYADVQDDGTFTMLVPSGKNYMGMYLGPNWIPTNTDYLLEDGVDVPKGKTVEIEVRIAPHHVEVKSPSAAQNEEQSAAIATGKSDSPTQDDAGYDMSHVVHFELGRTQFVNGDKITIEEIRGTSDKIAAGNTYIIKGTYHLASEKKAMLAAFTTGDASNPQHVQMQSIPNQRTQTMMVDQGDGTFSLILYMWYDGHPHVSFYANGQATGGVYFGTGDSLYK